MEFFELIEIGIIAGFVFYVLYWILGYLCWRFGAPKYEADNEGDER
jgi:hypothetical protein